MEKKGCTLKELNNLVGRLNHACNIIPLGNHFLNRLRAKIDNKRNRKSFVKLESRHLEDLRLWEEILKRTNEGISINLIVNRRPTKIYLSDSCPFGLGGFSASSGRAWRLKLPSELIGKVSNNLLEFIAEVICMWLDTHEGRMNDLDYCCAFGGNTSAVSWLHLSNFDEANQSSHQTTARHLASLCIGHNICIYSQHFKGSWNVVADSLSRDYHIPDHILPVFLDFLCPLQLPTGFHLRPLPPKIVSWVFKTLQLSTKQVHAQQEQMASTIGAGLVGAHFCKASNWATIRSWIASHLNFTPALVAFLRKPYETRSLQDAVRTIWLQKQLERPWIKWQRSSSPEIDQTHSNEEGNWTSN